MNAFSRKSMGTRRVFPGVMVGILALGFCLPACSAQTSKDKAKTAGGDKVLAKVNGQPITEADVMKSGADAFAQIERQYEQSKRETLENQLQQAIQDRLVEVEAKAKGTTSAQLLADLKPAPVTDADIDAFYEQNKAQIPQPKERIAPQIKMYLERQREGETRQKFFSDLQAKYKVDMLLEPVRVDVAATGPAKGPQTAPVTIVEFSDFQCPFCSRLVPTLDEVQKKYGDKVRIVFRQFPLPMHPNAQKAAEAALCANEQGKFWELHDVMFKDQQALAVDQLKASAAKIAGLNAEQFNTCLDSGKHAADVKADQDAGTVAGVSGTPAMFVNGRFINGAVPLDQITKVIDEELSRSSNTASK